MSAPVAVNTADGTCWTRRGALRGGEALYAPEGVCDCPPFVMATLAELAEHGIVGSADALPMPVGPAPVSEDELDSAVEELSAFLRVRLALASAQRGRRELRARVAELEAEREKLVRWHGEDAKTITTLVARVDRYRARATALQNDALSMRGSLAPADGNRKVPFELGETLAPAVDWLIARVAELERRIAAEECRCPEPAPLCEGCRCQCHTVAQPSAADPQALRKEDTADLVTLAPAHRAEADYDAALQTISLELTATREQWSAWQKALKVDLARTTNRGSCTTSHATWRGIHVAIRCWLAEEDVTPQVQRLRTLLAGQREQAAADAPHEGPQHHTYRLGRDLPETGGAR